MRFLSKLSFLSSAEPTSSIPLARILTLRRVISSSPIKRHYTVCFALFWKSQAKGLTFKPPVSTNFVPIPVTQIQVQHPLIPVQKILKSYIIQNCHEPLSIVTLCSTPGPHVATTLSKMHRQPSARTCPRLLKILLKSLLWQSNAPAPTVAQIAFQVSNQRKESKDQVKRENWPKLALRFCILYYDDPALHTSCNLS